MGSFGQYFDNCLVDWVFCIEFDQMQTRDALDRLDAYLLVSHRQAVSIYFLIPQLQLAQQVDYLVIQGFGIFHEDALSVERPRVHFWSFGQWSLTIFTLSVEAQSFF
jgi:ribulose bisphosphate carboxylase small subunit